MTNRPDNKAPLAIDEWITVVTPIGAQITIYRNKDVYRVTAIDCYVRRLRDPQAFVTERPARDLARVWTLELLRNSTGFEVRTKRDGIITTYQVPEAKP